MQDQVFENFELHPLITQERCTGNGYVVIARHYEASNEAEVTGIRLDYDEAMRKGGGAKRKNSDKGSMDEITLGKSVARSRAQVRRKILAMGADRMLTLTFRKNVTDLSEAWTCHKYFCRLMREKFGVKFRYVSVPEQQKRGAWHFHLAIPGYMKANRVRKLWRRAVGHRGGNIDITSPRRFGKGNWNPKRIAGYLSKYLNKTDSVEFNRRRYSSGGDIPEPRVERGWLPLGGATLRILGQVAEKLTGKETQYYWEAEGFRGIAYAST